MTVRFHKFVIAATLAFVAVQPTTVLAQAEKTVKGGWDLATNKGNRTAPPLACDRGQACDDALAWSWGESNQQSLATAEFTPAKGDAFSMCGGTACDNSDASGKTSPVTLNQRNMAPATGPGSVVLRTNPPIMTKDVADKTMAADDWNPQSRCASGKHFKEVVLMRGMLAITLTDVLVSSCDTSAITLSYQSMAINEKGLPRTKTKGQASTK
ncbi:MAG: hypothetical protein RIS52_230 [Pseudomonadota bacterium]